MRVIAGKCRRLLLETIKGNDTRPTTDRIKETLFNIINDDLYDCRFLDLFAGSGQIGIEALSRGAKHATFVDNNKKAIECINNNIIKCKLENESTIICDNYFSALKRFKDNSFDIIFIDPPYGNQLEKEIIEYLSSSDIIEKDGLIIIEASLDTDFSYISDLGFKMIKEKKYKTNKHVFLKRYIYE